MTHGTDIRVYEIKGCITEGRKRITGTQKGNNRSTDNFGKILRVKLIFLN